MARTRIPIWRTLRGRLAVASIAGIVAASVAFALVSVALVRSVSQDHAREQFDQEAVRVAQLASTQIERALTGGRCPRFAQEDLDAFVGPESRIYGGGLPLCPGTEDTPFQEVPAPISSAINRNVLSRQGYVRLDDHLPEAFSSSVATAAPIVIGGSSPGEIIVMKRRDEVPTAFVDVIPSLVLAAVLGLVPAVLLTLLLTNRITRPISHMRHAADRVAEGDLTAEVAPAGSAELDALARDFNLMISQLRQREDQSRDFLMKVTHDLRTPLTAIRGHVQALSDGVVPQEMRQRSLDVVDSEAERLERLVRDLLDLARMQARQFRVQLHETDPSMVIEDAVAVRAAQAAEKGVTLRCSPTPDTVIVTDPDRLRQVADNLIDNALRWTPTGGTVEVTTDVTEDGGLRFEVRDTGPGIPAEQHDAIFDAFTSGESPDGRTSSGLGLAICRQLSRILGGDVTVHDAKDGGACFVVTLPARAPDPV